MRCNLCGNEAARFHPFGRNNSVIDLHRIVGAGRRQNAMCPPCAALDRERLVALYLQRRTTLYETGGRVLHVAPENGLARQLRQVASIRYVSVDVANEVVMAMVRMDVARLGFPSQSFDVAICNHVLEHVEDDAVAMKELYRVLAPGGWAIVQVPISVVDAHTYEDARWQSASDREREFGQADHVRIYGADYRDRLRRHGFAVETLTAAEAFGGDLVREHSLVGAEPIFIARRPR
jgi:predicted SAM-dependent methyltransferase